jgi:plastocyanin
VKGKLAKNSTLTIKQVNKQFVPRLAVAPRGTKLELPNEDSIFHNAFSLSPGNTFDLGTYRSGDQPGSVTLVTPGVVKIFCNIHSQMSASVLVTPSTLFAQVKPDGTFRISGIPPGRHQIAAWTPSSEPVLRDVDVQPGDNEPVTFTLNGKPGQAHTNKYGQPYGSYAE